MTADRYTPLSSAPEAMTVLLVERDILIRIAVANYLRECGLLVIEAVSPDEAKDVLRSNVRVNAAMISLAAAEAFALTQWGRAQRPHARFVIVPTLQRLAQEAHRLCGARQRPHHRYQLEQRLRRLRS